MNRLWNSAERISSQPYREALDAIELVNDPDTGFARLRIKIMGKTAGIIIIGNEVLSGKTQDTNSRFLAIELRSLGVDLRRILVIPDEIETIGEAARTFSSRWDYVFTTGGVGPTHDDVTMEGVSYGFGVRAVLDPRLESRLRDRYGKDINAARLRMALVPEGADLLAEGDLFAPVVRYKNIYIFPGIPRILYERFAVIKEQFRDKPFFLRVLYVNQGEGVIAGLMDQVIADFPEISLGSYPVIENPEYKVKVTIESKDKNYLEDAFRALSEKMPRGSIVRTE